MPIYLILRGGLGNQLFMFASMVAFAKSSQRNLQLITHWFGTTQREEKFESHKRSFELGQLRSIVIFRNKFTEFFDSFFYAIFIASLRFPWIEKLGIVVDGDREQQTSRKWAGLIYHGYMQAPNNFNGIRNEIAELLCLDSESEAKLRLKLENRVKYGRKIAVHVRRGDYLLTETKENVLSTEYYNRCLSRLIAEEHDVFFFSDDLKWCKANFRAENYFFVEESNPLFAMKLMSYCDDFILSSSTFGWWGAWLSETLDKRVIYPHPYNSESPKIWAFLPQLNWIPERAIYAR